MQNFTSFTPNLQQFSSSSANPTPTLNTTTTSPTELQLNMNFNSNTSPSFDEQQMQFADLQQQIDLQQFMMAAAAMDQSNPLHGLYLSQLANVTATAAQRSSSNGLNGSQPNSNAVALTHPKANEPLHPTNSNAFSQQAQSHSPSSPTPSSTLQQQLMESIFGGGNAVEIANKLQLHQSVLQSLQSPSTVLPSDANSEELAQLMASIISSSGMAGVLSNSQSNDSLENATQKLSASSNATTAERISPEMDLTASAFFDQLHLLNLFGVGGDPGNDMGASMAAMLAAAAAASNNPTSSMDGSGQQRLANFLNDSSALSGMSDSRGIR